MGLELGFITSESTILVQSCFKLRSVTRLNSAVNQALSSAEINLSWKTRVASCTKRRVQPMVDFTTLQVAIPSITFYETILQTLIYIHSK